MPLCHGDALAGAVLSSTKLPEKEVGKCPCGRLYGLSADEERIHFHRAEIPVRQHPHELPGLKPCSRAVFARRGDPQPDDGACRGSFVDGDSELAVNAHGGYVVVLAVGESRRGGAGPMITEWCARFEGIVGVPRSRRWSGEAMSILGRWMILRAVALESGRAPNRNARSMPALGHEVLVAVVRHELEPQRRVPADNTGDAGAASGRHLRGARAP